MRINVYTAHSDDVSYSIPLYLKYLYETGSNIKLLYIFQKTNYAPNLDDHRVSRVSKERMLEVRGFCQKWKIKFEGLNYKDACLRKDYSGKEVCHNQQMTKTDRRLIQRLSSIIEPADLSLFPLAIGDHIDHRILMEIGILQTQQGLNLGFYEDLPYACEFEDDRIKSYLDYVSKKISFNLVKVTIRDDSFRKTKTLAARINKSQVSEKYIHQIIAYSERRFQCEGGHERVWLVRS